MLPIGASGNSHCQRPPVLRARHPRAEMDEDANNVTRALMGYRNITRLTDKAASFDKEATMRSGNYPKYIHGIADGLSRLARMPA